MSAATNTDTNNDGSQITHVLNRDKKYLSEHGQKLFNAINCLLDDQEQLELTQSLFKYQREHNVFTLVRSCRELFDTSRKKSLMLFMRPVIPIRDRFHYDEYYKLFFPEEFSTNVKSIFSDLIPKDLLEKTLKKADDKKKALMEKEIEKEQEERLKTIKLLEKANYDLNLDLQQLMNKASLHDQVKSLKDEVSQELEAEKNKDNKKLTNTEESEIIEKNTAQVAGFRIIDLAPNENESLGFDICLGPTGTFIMISYIEPGCLVEKMGMKIGDELVSVNEISFKMIDVEQAIEILSTQPTLRIVLQKSGFMPEVSLINDEKENKIQSQLVSPQNISDDFHFNNQWENPFCTLIRAPAESKLSFKKHLRRVFLRPRLDDSKNLKNNLYLGFKIRGGIEHALGVFISYVEPKSHADLLGLRISDQIIDVNGQSFSRISSIEALDILKSNYLNYINTKMPIRLTVRYLGKLPVILNKNTDEKSSKNCDASFAFEENKPVIDYQLINSKLAQYFSSKKDFLLFKYYLIEYLFGRLKIQYFLYLVFNKLKSNPQILNDDCLSIWINCKHSQSDYIIYKQILEYKLKNLQNEKLVVNNKILNNDFMNSLIVRSSETLNDLNINSIKTSSKLDTFTYDYQNPGAPMLKKMLCKSLDDLNYNNF